MERHPRNLRMQRPFRGRPATREIRGRDGAIRCFRIRAGHLTPLRASIADGLARFSAFGLVAAGCIAVINTRPHAPALMICAILAPTVGFPLLKRLHRVFLRRTTTIEISRDLLRIRGKLGWKSYDRRAQHRFLLLQHDRARLERERHELGDRKAQLKGQVIERAKYYQESWHLVFEYLGQRVDIASVYRQKDARALLARLSWCDKVMDGQRGTGDGVVLDAESQWFNDPGDVPVGP